MEMSVVVLFCMPVLGSLLVKFVFWWLEDEP